MAPTHILLVDNNEGDKFLIEEALQVSNISRSICVIEDGVDAINFLFKEGMYQNTTAPDLILLDINLLEKNGQEFLKVVKAIKHLLLIPDITLSAWSSRHDAPISYTNNAYGYIIKPGDAHGLLGGVKRIENFWDSKVQFAKSF